MHAAAEVRLCVNLSIYLLSIKHTIGNVLYSMHSSLATMLSIICIAYLSTKLHVPHYDTSQVVRYTMSCCRAVAMCMHR